MSLSTMLVSAPGESTRATPSSRQQVFDINLFGVMRVNHAVLPYFRKAGRGLIIYISSALGRIVLPFLAIYTASKHAIEGFAESTSYELAPLGIETVIVQPGTYGTTFLEHPINPESDVSNTYGLTTKRFDALGRGFEERAKSGNIGNPSEVAKTLVEEVERAGGERPLRRVVGQDVKVPVSAINQTCDHVQGHLLRTSGLK